MENVLFGSKISNKILYLTWETTEYIFDENNYCWKNESGLNNLGKLIIYDY